MFEFLSALLSDKKDDSIFTCFSLFHIVFIFVFVTLSGFLCWFVKNKSKDKTKIINLFINIAFGLYILDFFLMPFAYGEIDVEKLPFHVCTAMCVMCFLSRYNSFLGKFKLQFAVLGFLSNFVYLVYPAGVMWHAVQPFSYRVIQTLSFHGIMMVYSMLVISCESESFRWRNCYKDLLVIVSMTAWAWLGNALYNSELRVYNWFFVVQDPFDIFPQSIAPYIMPILNIVVFFAVEMFVYLIFAKITRPIKNKN